MNNITLPHSISKFDENFDGSIINDILLKGNTSIRS